MFVREHPSLIKMALLQVEAAKVAKVREAAISKLKSLEKQKAEVEKTRDDIKYDPRCLLPFPHHCNLFLPSIVVAPPPLPLPLPIWPPSR